MQHLAGQASFRIVSALRCARTANSQSPLDANIATIVRVYTAFGRGALAEILRAVTDEVNRAAEAASTAVPRYRCGTTRMRWRAFPRISAAHWNGSL
jgi:hypothetical protein